MVLNLRDWLIIIGLVILACILIDGYRRMRRARQDALLMSREMGGDMVSSPLDEDYNPELPNGGARVLEPGSDSDAVRAPEKIEPVILADPDQAANAELAVDEDSLIAGERIAVEEPVVVSQPEVKRVRAGQKAAKRAPDKLPQDGLQEVIVINVQAKMTAGFDGETLRELLEACGLSHGEMGIFHRHEEDDLLSPVQFSVANAVEPGYFELDRMSEMSTPAVSFFMSIPGPKDYMKAFDYMLETANCLVRNLDGELKDEQRSVMTTQTIEHCRFRIKEFERKQLSRAHV